MAQFYIATRLARHEEHNLVRDLLVAAGHTCTYDWTIHGSVKEEGGEALRVVADAEFDGVRQADFVVSMLPAGRGTHAELGAAAVLCKPTRMHVYPIWGELFKAGKATCMAYHHSYAEHHVTDSLEQFAQEVIDWWTEYEASAMGIGEDLGNCE